MSDIFFFQAIVIVCGTISFVASLQFLRRYLELREQRRASLSADDLTTRLERIEQAVETTAVEVERIAEANRFMARLLSDSPGMPKPASTPPRVITPH